MRWDGRLVAELDFLPAFGVIAHFIVLNLSQYFLVWFWEWAVIVWVSIARMEVHSSIGTLSETVHITGLSANMCDRESNSWHGTLLLVIRFGDCTSLRLMLHVTSSGLTYW